MLESEFYVIAIVALLPLTAVMLVTQGNPYHALVIRGIVGAIAALVYTLFGAADVALTEALVGTMLSITLYAIAVRSSMCMRLGVVSIADLDEKASGADSLLSQLREALAPHYLRLELVSYPNLDALHTALQTKDIHAICLPAANAQRRDVDPSTPPYHVQVRVASLRQILQAAIPATTALISLVHPCVEVGCSARSPESSHPFPADYPSNQEYLL